NEADLDDSTIYLYFDQKSNLSIAPGALEVTADIELMGESIRPGDRAWVYNTGIGDWTVERLGDTGLNVQTIASPSYKGQGISVGVGTNVFDHLGIPHDTLDPVATAELAVKRLGKLMLDGVEFQDTQVLTDTYTAKLM